MSKKDKSNTDPPKVNINLPKNEYHSCPTLTDTQAESSEWQTQGHRLGEGTAPRPVTAALPRRTDYNVRRTVNCEYHEGLLRDIRDRMREFGDIEEDGMGPSEDTEEDLMGPSEDNEEENLQIVGRDHPASSEAALAGYRYRTNG